MVMVIVSQKAQKKPFGEDTEGLLLLRNCLKIKDY